MNVVFFIHFQLWLQTFHSDTITFKEATLEANFFFKTMDPAIIFFEVSFLPTFQIVFFSSIPSVKCYARMTNVSSSICWTAFVWRIANKTACTYKERIKINGKLKLIVPLWNCLSDKKFYKIMIILTFSFTVSFTF